MNHCKLQSKEKVDYYLNNQVVENFDNVYSPYLTSSSECTSVSNLDSERRKVLATPAKNCEPSKIVRNIDRENNGRNNEQCSEENKENSNPLETNSEEMDNGFSDVPNESAREELLTREDDGLEKIVDVTNQNEKSTILYHKESEDCIEITSKNASPAGLSEDVSNENVNASDQSNETSPAVCAKSDEDDDIEIVYEKLGDKLVEEQLNHVEIIGFISNTNSSNGGQTDKEKTFCTRKKRCRK